MDAGDRKKLFDMKRDARNKGKQQKVLKADKHFDELFAPENEEDGNCFKPLFYNTFKMKQTLWQPTSAQ